MRKIYVKPKVKVAKIIPSQLLAGSDPEPFERFADEEEVDDAISGTEVEEGYPGFGF